MNFCFFYCRPEIATHNTGTVNLTFWFLQPGTLTWQSITVHNILWLKIHLFLEVCLKIQLLITSRLFRFWYDNNKPFLKKGSYQMLRFLSRTLPCCVLSCSCTGLNALHSHTTSMGMDFSRGSIRQCYCPKSANPQPNSFLFTCAKFPLGDKRHTEKTWACGSSKFVWIHPHNITDRLSTPHWLWAFPLSFQEHGLFGGSTEQKRTRDTKKDLSKIVQHKTSTGCLKNDEKNIRVNSIHVLNAFNVCSAKEKVSILFLNWYKH